MTENPNVICNDCGYCKQNKQLKERLKKTQELGLEVRRENTKLKELLKEAYPVIEFGDGAMMSKWEENWLTKAKEILGEDK